MKTKNSYLSIAIGAIIVLTVLLRLYKVSGPIADWHSWRQADTAAVARNFINFGFDPFRPRYDDLSNIQSGKDNPQGWRMVEFPVFQSIAYLGYRIFPQFSIEVWLRLVTILAAAGTTYVLFRLVSLVSNIGTGFVAAFVFAVLPFSIYYGRAILPEMLAVFLSLASVYMMLLSTENKKRSRVFLVIVSSFLGAFALLVKPVSIFFLLPVLTIQFRIFRQRAWSIGEVVLYWLVTLMPLFLWRMWIAQFPEGVPAFDWLFNKGDIRLKGAWFYWLFAERLAKLILGYWGIVLFGLGLVAVNVKKEGIYVWFLAGVLLYFLVIAGGNVQHDYYQVLILPTVCVMAAKGIRFLLTHTGFSWILRHGVALVSLIFTLAFSWHTIRSYYWINRMEIVEAGKVADLLLPKNAKVIAPYSGDTSFLYQVNRQGWPEGFDIEKKRAQGATHYITVSSLEDNLEAKDLAEKHEVLIHNDKFTIIKFK